MKIGYIKSVKGEVSVKEQITSLLNYGVPHDKIYDSEEGHTIFDVISSIRSPSDEIVIYSGAVIGRPKFKKLLKDMSKIDNALYNVKADKYVLFTEGDEMASLLDDIEKAEKRRGGQGGKPNSIGEQAHKRILKMAGKGLNSREITDQLNLTRKPTENKGEPYKPTTVWRYTTKPLANQKKGKKK